MPEYIVSLTTIPSKFEHLYLTIDSLMNQTLLPSKIIIHIPYQYNFRLNGSEISNTQIEQFLNKYKGFNITINRVDQDYGPGTKLLGLLYSNLLPLDTTNTYIILVDDDLIYKPYMIERFDQEIKENKTEIASYWTYRYNEITIGQGSDGFLIQLKQLDRFLNYYDKIKQQDYVNYHDDFYISYYFYLMQKSITYIKPPNNCAIYEMHPHTYTDALYKLQDKYARTNVNHYTYSILTTLHSNGYLNI